MRKPWTSTPSEHARATHRVHSARAALPVPPGSHAGTLSSGQSAVAEPVLVSASASGLRISFRDRRGEEIWPWEVLVAAGPLLKGEPILLGHRDRPGARLFIADDALREELLRHAPNLRKESRGGARIWPMLLLAAGILGVFAWLLYSSFSPARIIADMLPRELHDKLGLALTTSMTNGRICNDPDGQAALQTMLLKLSVSRDEMQRYNVVAGRIGMINALTAPGGRVLMGEELIRFARSPDEVAGVLAHELGHADHRDPEAALVRVAGLSLLGMLMFGDGNIGSLAVLLTEMSFSRQAERKADEVSIARMRRAGANPAALADFFERLMKKHGGSGEGGVSALFQTHPPTKERIARLRAAALPSSRPILDNAQWRALRNICRSTAPLTD